MDPSIKKLSNTARGKPAIFCNKIKVALFIQRPTQRKAQIKTKCVLKPGPTSIKICVERLTFHPRIGGVAKI